MPKEEKGGMVENIVGMLWPKPVKEESLTPQKHRK